jgi:GNAT superfamily N-acetyltransferase
MEIKLYENWMKPQVVQLFCTQYGTNKTEQENLMENFYEHPFQKNKCIRIVALDGDKVIGFQSLFYWPYEKGGKVFNSYQSGNSLVHADYRGKGIFQKLLNYLDEYNKELKIDFLMGFPVQQSYGSFMKNKWSNPLNLQWYISIINPLAFIFPVNIALLHFDKMPIRITQTLSSDTFRLVYNKHFETWRSSFSDTSKYCFFNYSENGNQITFSLKINRRNKWINELIIGDIRSSTNDISFIKKAVSKLKRKAFSCFSVSVIMVAVNDHALVPINRILSSKNFFKIRKTIYFITKAFINDAAINDPKKWELYRSDIDTW